MSDNWCELFKTGTHTDMNGKTKTYTTKDLDTIVKNFNDGKNDVPIVIGHPSDTAPAYGWVEKLKAEGGKLLGTFKDTAEEFKKWANEGRYKRRSISLYGDGTLRHVGFLGAMPPAIKGLAPYQFAENKEDLYEFEEDENLTNTLDYAEQLSAKDKKIAELEADLKAKTTDTNNFAEEKKKKDEKIAELEAEIAKTAKEKQKAEIESFCEECLKKGAILPKQKKEISEFMEAISETTFDFAESDTKSVVDKFKRFIGGIKQVKLGETATEGNPAKDISNFTSSEIKNAIEIEIAKSRENGIEMSYPQALRKVKGE